MPNRSARYVRLWVNSFEASIALVGAVTSVTFFLNPDDLAHSPVGLALHPWDYVWNVGYLIGSIGILLGLWRGRGDVEAGGLMFFAGAILVQAGAVLDVVGWAQGIVGIAVYLSIVGACTARVLLIHRFSAAVVREDP